MDLSEILMQLYEDFNDRNIENVLAHLHTNQPGQTAGNGYFISGKCRKG